MTDAYTHAAQALGVPRDVIKTMMHRAVYGAPYPHHFHVALIAAGGVSTAISRFDDEIDFAIMKQLASFPPRMRRRMQAYWDAP